MRRLPILGLISIALGLAACNSDEARPSPLPPIVALGGADPTTRPRPSSPEDGKESLDELLAVVEGTPLTRRALERRLGIKRKGASEPDAAQLVEMRRETIQWAREVIFIKAAERANLTQLIPEGRLETYANEQLDKRVKAASKDIGEPISREEWLREQGITWPEFRERTRNQLLTTIYMQKLLVGIGGPTRPQIDLTVTPAEVRRIYADHQDRFDQQAGVRVATFQMPVDRFQAEGRGVLEEDALAMQQAEALAADFRAGVAIDAVVRKYQLAGDDEPLFEVTEEFAISFPDPELNAWAFDEARRVRDARIVTQAEGPFIIGLLEIRPSRSRSYDEVYDEIVEYVQLGRQRSLESALLIELLDKGSVVWPEELADVLMLAARADLERLRADPVLRGARLR